MKIIKIKAGSGNWYYSHEIAGELKATNVKSSARRLKGQNLEDVKKWLKRNGFKFKVKEASRLINGIDYWRARNGKDPCDNAIKFSLADTGDKIILL